MQMGVGFCLDGLGDVERAKGDCARAITLLEQSIVLLERIGSEEQTPRFNLALALLKAQRSAEAQAVAERGLRVSCRHGHITSQIHMRAVLAGCTLEHGDTEAAVNHLTAVTNAIEGGYLRLSVAEALELAADRAAGPLQEECMRLAAYVRNGLAGA